MSFLQLVTLDDKMQWRDNSILENGVLFDRYCNISLSLKNVMFVMFVIAQLVLGGVSVETNRTVEYVEYAF